MFTRGVTFIAIAFILVVPATVFLSFSSSSADAAPKSAPAGAKCDQTPDVDGNLYEDCCWTEKDPETKKDVKKCQGCTKAVGGSWECGDVHDGGPPIPTSGLPQLETVPPIRTLPGLPAGDLPVLEQVPPPILEPVVPQETIEETGPGFNQGTEGEPTLPVVCSEEAGLEKDSETGQCVPIESPVTEEQPEEAPEEEPEEEEQPEPVEEQPSEESDSEDNGNN